MAIYGKNANIFIKAYDLSGDSNRITLNIAIDTIDITGFGAKAKENKEGKYSWTLSEDGFWNSAVYHSDPVIHSLIGAGSQVVGIFPAGTTPGNLGYEGYGILTTYNPEAVIAGAVTFAAEFQGSNLLNRTILLNAGIKTANGTSTARNLGTAGLNIGITSILRALSGSHGTCNVKIQASTAEAGTYGDIFSFTQLTNELIAEQKNIATAPVGPWFRSVHTIGGASDSFDLTISCATEE